MFRGHRCWNFSLLRPSGLHHCLQCWSIVAEQWSNSYFLIDVKGIFMSHYIIEKKRKTPTSWFISICCSLKSWIQPLLKFIIYSLIQSRYGNIKTRINNVGILNNFIHEYHYALHNTPLLNLSIFTTTTLIPENISYITISKDRPSRTLL